MSTHTCVQIEKYVSHSNLKYYFAVDNTYVIKKLALLLFPFLHKVCQMLEGAMNKLGISAYIYDDVGGGDKSDGSI